jgi:hypothetical protein
MRFARRKSKSSLPNVTERSSIGRTDKPDTWENGLFANKANDTYTTVYGETQAKRVISIAALAALEAVVRCLVSCDHLPRRSWPLFRAKAMLGDLIAGFSSPGIQSQQEQSAA